MKTLFNKISFVLILFVTICHVSNAQNQISIEIDPATFAFNGYSAHLRWQPKQSEHILVGIGIYAMDLPEAMIKMNKMNRSTDWNVRIKTGLGLFSEYHFKKVNQGLFTGIQLGTQKFSISTPSEPIKETTITNQLSMLYAGYAFKPFKIPVYIKPWAGIGYSYELHKKSSFEIATYDNSKITAFATLHIGYTF